MQRKRDGRIIISRRTQTEARGVLGGISLEITTLQLKQAQAEEIQGDKHERLRRTLDCSVKEELYLLSARQKGTLGRLAVRCRAEKRRRQVELREELAAVKSGVARVWREHNRSRCRNRSSSSGGVDAGAGGGGKSRAAAVGRSLFALSSSSGRRDDNVAHGKKSDGIMLSVAGNGGKGEGEEISAGGRGSRALGSTAGENPPATPSPADAVKVESGTGAASVSVTTNKKHTKHKESRTVSWSSPSPTPTPMNTVGTLTCRRVKNSGSRGRGLQRRVRRAIPSAETTTAGIATAAAPKSSAVTTNHTDDSNGVFILAGGAFGVLSEEEAQALAALGRGAPRDPRLLLSESPPQPPSPLRRRRQRQQPESPWWAIRQDLPHEASELAELAPDNGLRSGDGRGDGVGGGRFVRVGGDCGGMMSGSAGGRNVGRCPIDMLERAADKLARRIQAEEDLSRRRLGMASLPSW